MAGKSHRPRLLTAKGWWLLALVLALHGAYYFSALSTEAYLIDDSIQYLTLAENMAEHGLYSQSYSAPYSPDLQRPPGYPVFLLLCGGHAWLVLLLQQLMVLAAGYFLFRLLALFADVKWARRGAWFWLLQPYPVVMASFFLSEGPFLCFMALGLWLFFAFRRSICPWQLLPSLAALGAASYFRPIGLLLLLPLAVYAAVFSLRKRRWKPLAVALALPLLLLAPWVVRNGVATGHWTFNSMGAMGMVHGRLGGMEAERLGLPAEEHSWFMAGDSLAAQSVGLDGLKDYPDDVQSHETEVYRVGTGLVLRHYLSDPVGAFKAQVKAFWGMLKGLGYGWSLRISQSRPFALGAAVWQALLNLLMFLGTAWALLAWRKMPAGTGIMVFLLALLYLASMAVWADGRYRVPIDLLHVALAALALARAKAGLRSFDKDAACSGGEE